VVLVRRRDESGAVAVLTGVLAVSLFIIAGLVVDLGMARDQKRVAQNAADAAALAGASAMYASGSLDKTAAVAAAKSYAQKNYGTTEADWTGCTDLGRTGSFSTFARSTETDCISFRPAVKPTEIRVVLPNRTMRTPFGSLAGVSSVVIGGTANAKVDATTIQGEGGLRPWGICSTVANTSGNVTFVPMNGGQSRATGQAADPCGTDAPPGGWWVAQCTGQSNANGATEASVLNGCPTSAYTPVPNQPGGATALYNHMTGYCPKKSENSTCLASDPGNNFHNSSDEWQTLVGHHITMPVFCFPPQCSDTAFTAQGQNASYGIWRLATVLVCGFKLNPRPASTGWPTTGACATNNPNNYSSNSVTAGAGFFLVIEKLQGGPSGDWELPQPPTDPHLSW
jgi:Flp pilus assembly protein TadG